jgi:hypothetical protein
MPRKKNDKIDETVASVAGKRVKKLSAKAATNAEASAAQPTKIKLKTTSKAAKSPAPAEESHSVVESPKGPTIEINSSSPEPEPEPHKPHKVNVHFRVFINHKLVHSETFPEEDFKFYGHRNYHSYKC